MARKPKTVAERKRVVDFLVKLKTILAEADDSLDSERTLAGRILRSQRGQVAEVARLMQENQRLYAEAKKRSAEYQENLAKMGREYSAMLVREREKSGKKLEDEWQEQVEFLKKRAKELGTQLEAAKKMADAGGDSHFLEEQMNPTRIKQYLDSGKDYDKVKGMKWCARGVPSLSRHRRDSSPGEEVVGGLFFYFEAVRAESRPSRRVRETAVASMASSRDSAAATPSS